MSSSSRKAARRASRGMRAAPLGRRVCAFLIDWYVGSLVTALPIAAVAMNLGLEMTDQNIIEYAEPYGLVAGLAGILAGLIYYALVPLVTDGQTLGKRLLKLRIVSADGDPATPLQLVLRQGLGLILLEQDAVGTGTVVQQVLSLTLGSTVSVVSSWVGLVLTLVSFALCLVRKDNRALHDLIAGTKLVYVG